MFGRYRIDVGTGHLMDTGRHFGGGGQTETKTSDSAPWQPQQSYLTDMFSKAQNWYDGGGVKAYGGPTFAGLSPTTQQGIAGSVNTANGGLSQQAGQAGSQWGNMINGKYMDANSNPYLQSYMNAANRNITQNLTQNILPGISSAAEAQGAYGGAREGIAQGVAADSAMRQIGDTDAMIANNGYNTGLQNMQYALAMTPTVQESTLLPSQVTTQAGQLLDQNNQAALTNAEKQYYTGQELPLSNLQNYANLINGKYGGTSNSVSSGTQDTSSMQDIGAILSIMAMFA